MIDIILETISIKSISNITYGYTEKSKTNNQKYKYLRITDIQDSNVQWNDVPFCDISDENFPKYKLSKGDIVFARTGATTGKSYLINDCPDSVYASYLIRVKLKNGGFEPKYVHYFFQTPSYWASINSGISGSTLGGFNAKKLGELRIPQFTLSEQQQIVEKLDTAFDLIDRAKANIEKNIQNAKELFQSKLNQVFSERGEGWELTSLGALSHINYGYTEKAVFQNIGPKYLRITDLTENGVIWNTVPHCIIDQANLHKYQLQKGDIVFARTGATTGKSYLFKDDEFSVFASYLIRLRINDMNKILPLFVYLFFQSGMYWESIKSGITGSAQGGFNATKLSDLIISFPTDIHKQRQFVKDFEDLKYNLDTLQQKYQQKLANLEQLQKSILEKAFKGDLIK